MTTSMTASTTASLKRRLKCFAATRMTLNAHLNLTFNLRLILSELLSGFSPIAIGLIVSVTSATGLFFAFTPTAVARPIDSDLVVPNGTGEADQDAIQKDKMKNIDISSDAAQSRTPPVKKYPYKSFVPDYEPEESAESLSTAAGAPHRARQTPQKYSSGIRVGPFNPTNLQSDNPKQGITYNNVYGNYPTTLITLDYENQFIRSRVGKVGYKFTLGFLSAKGQGRFADNPPVVADEILSLYSFPIGIGLEYHMQFAYNQIVIPFIEGGGDYFGFIESRPDETFNNGGLRIGGGAAAHASGGLQIQLDWLDRQAIWHLDEEYGINHIFLTADVRQIFGLSSKFDFTSLVYEGGFTFEF